MRQPPVSGRKSKTFEKVETKTNDISELEMAQKFEPEKAKEVDPEVAETLELNSENVSLGNVRLSESHLWTSEEVGNEIEVSVQLNVAGSPDTGDFSSDSEDEDLDFSPELDATTSIPGINAIILFCCKTCPV